MAFVRAGRSLFTSLSDTPADYSGDGGKFLQVKPTEDGIRFVDGSETVSHEGLTDMPDVGGTNSDHDTRYLRKDGSNADEEIDIGSQDFRTTGDIYANDGIFSAGSVKIGTLLIQQPGGATGPAVSTTGFEGEFTGTFDGDGSAITNVDANPQNHTELLDMPSTDNDDHDGRYYTETEVDNIVDDKQDNIPYDAQLRAGMISMI